jgi:hypothetical protein
MYTCMGTEMGVEMEWSAAVMDQMPVDETLPGGEVSLPPCKVQGRRKGRGRKERREEEEEASNKQRKLGTLDD